MSVIDERGLEVPPEDRPPQVHFSNEEIQRARLHLIRSFAAGGVSNRVIGRIFNVNDKTIAAWLETPL